MRQLGIVLVGVGFGLAIGAFVVLDPLTPVKEKIAVAVRPDGCSDDNFPVELTFTNNSRSTVTWMNIEVKVKAVGYSSALETESFTLDKIIGGGESFVQCIRLPRTYQGSANNSLITDTYKEYAPENLIFSAKVLVAHAE